MDVENGPKYWSRRTHGTRGSRYTPSAEVQSTTASRTNDISIVLIWRISFESFTKGGGERHRGHWSVIYEEDIGSAWEWCQIKLKTSCDVSVPLNHLKTTVLDGARSMFATLPLSW